MLRLERRGRVDLVGREGHGGLCLAALDGGVEVQGVPARRGADHQAVPRDAVIVDDSVGHGVGHRVVVVVARGADRLQGSLDDHHLEGVLVLAGVERGAVLHDVEAVAVTVVTRRAISQLDCQRAPKGALEVGLGRDGAHDGIPSG